MKILTFSPLEMPFTTGARYTGLERLAVEHSEQWAKLGHDVTILCHKDTNTSLPILPCDGYEVIRRPDHAEIHAFQKYQSDFRNYDVIWDIGHLHLIARFMPNMPVVSVMNSAPEHNVYPKAPYNIVCWSRWGVSEFRKYYHQDARYQETIMVDSDVYKPKGNRGDRFLTLGRMHEAKGNLNAINLCKKLGLKLDVAGGRGSEHTAVDELTPYEKVVMDACDGKQIVFHGEVSEEEKLELMQTCQALLYVTNHAEMTSHKLQEAMLCGAPVIAPNVGGIPEIVTQGKDGYLCKTEDEYKDAINCLDQLDPMATRDALVQKYAPKNVAEGYLSLFEKVADGLRWK